MSACNVVVYIKPTGLASSEAMKVNPNTTSQVNCTAGSYAGYPLRSFTSVLSRAKDRQQTSRIVLTGSITSDEDSIETRTSSFKVLDVGSEEELFCLLMIQNYIYAYLPVTIYVYGKKI